MHEPDLVVLAIDNNEPIALVEDFAEFMELTFSPLLDPGAEVSTLYRITGYPTSMFVDENGVIQIVHIGFMAEDQLDSYLAQMGVGETVASE
jgi:hypothetical protein